MRSLYLLALTLLLSGVAGCNRREPVAASINPAQIRYNVAGYRAVEFHLMDGTRCVAYSSMVTCEWQRPVILVPRPQ